MKRATRNAVTRAWGLSTVGVGVAFLVRPHALAGLGTGGRHTPDNTVVRVLGGRQLLQGALITRTPTPLLVVGGTVTDALHAASMLAVAAFWPRYRKAALTSATIAGASGIVGATIVLDDRRSKHRNVTDRDVPRGTSGVSR